MQVELRPDVQTGRLRSVVVTLGDANVPTVVALPDDIYGFRIRPAEKSVRYALNGNPAATQATASGATVAASSFGQGAVAVADQWETRTIATGGGRALHLASADAATVVTIEVF